MVWCLSGFGRLNPNCLCLVYNLVAVFSAINKQLIDVRLKRLQRLE